MASTKAANLLRSLWILGTFTLFFNWIPFFFIAIRARKLSWALWGCLYTAITLGVLNTIYLWPIGTWQAYTQFFLLFGGWLFSIGHAFVIRKEYLRRVYGGNDQKAAPKAEQEAESGHISVSKANNDDVDADSEAANSGEENRIDATLKIASSAPEKEIQTVTYTGTMVAEQTTGPSSSAKLNINEASEAELANLPGIGPILAKRVIDLRSRYGGFESAEHFFTELRLSPHRQDALLKLITVIREEQSSETKQHGQAESNKQQSVKSNAASASNSAEKEQRKGRVIDY